MYGLGSRLLGYGSPPPARKIPTSLEEMLSEYFSTGDKKDFKVFYFSEILNYNQENITQESWSAVPLHKIKIVFKASNKMQEFTVADILRWLENNAKWNDLKWVAEDRVENQLPSLSPLLHISILNLNDIFFNINDITELANWLRNNNTVTNLHLVNTFVVGEKVVVLANIFKTNTTIKHINLINNTIESDGVEALLKINKFEKIVEEILVTFSKFEGTIKTFESKNIFDENFKNERLKYNEDKQLNMKLVRLQNLSSKVLNSEVSNPEVKKISNLIMRGDNVIKESYKKLTIAFGDDKSGKSTNIKLINDTAEIVMFYDKDIHNWRFERSCEIINDSKTATGLEKSNLNKSPLPFPPLPTPKIPTKFIGQDTIFMECPGIGNIGDKNIEHIIATKYFIWQIFNKTELFKSLLTMRDSFDTNVAIINLIKDFAEIFRDQDEEKWFENITNLQHSIVLMVTHVEQGKTEEYIKSKISEYIVDSADQSLKPCHKTIGEFLKNNISIFYKPIRYPPSVNENNEISTLVHIKNPSNFAKAKYGNDYLTLPLTLFPKSLELVQLLCRQSYDNISNINQIILNFFKNVLADVTDPFKSVYSLNLHNELNPAAFFKYWDIVKPCFPEVIIHKKEEPVVQKSYFTALVEMKKFKEVLNVAQSFRESYKTSPNATEKQFNNDKATLIGYLKIIRDSYGKEKTQEEILAFQKQMDNYIYILQQQTDILKFCKKLGNFVVHKLFEGVIKDIDVIINKMLIPAIKCMDLKPNQSVEYYKEAIELLNYWRKTENLYDSAETQESLSKANLYIGINYVKMADEAIKTGKNEEIVNKYLYDAGECYVRSITYCKTFNVFNAYKAFGDLLCRLKNKDEALNEAIKYYEIINYHEDIENCFSLLKNNNNNNKNKLIDINIKHAQYALEIGQTQFARDYLKQAMSLANKQAMDLANSYEKIIAKITIERVKTYKVEEEIKFFNNKWIQKNYARLKTGESFDYSKFIDEKISNTSINNAKIIDERARATCLEITDKFLRVKLAVNNNNNNAAPAVIKNDEQAPAELQSQGENNNVNPVETPIVNNIFLDLEQESDDEEEESESDNDKLPDQEGNNNNNFKFENEILHPEDENDNLYDVQEELQVNNQQVKEGDNPIVPPANNNNAAPIVNFNYYQPAQGGNNNNNPYIADDNNREPQQQVAPHDLLLLNPNEEGYEVNIIGGGNY